MNIQRSTRERGFSLIEVMIAVLVLSFGLVALAALQGGLFRASGEAKARANAMTIAQNVLENAKTFAVVTPAAGYKGGAYATLADKTFTSSVGGVAYTVAQTVATRLIGSNNEFKDVTVTVTWQGSDAEAKQVQLVDSVPNVSPSDSVLVLRTPTNTEAGPQVWVVPPNKDNPAVAPIPFGDVNDTAAASTNPVLEQFVDDLSAITKFSVMTFTGASSVEEVRLTRKVDVNAVSCLCERDDGTVSTAANPAYQPTVWNGKLRAYSEPKMAPMGTKIGRPVSTNSEITPACTVCCRDHHESAGRTPRPDPWRSLAANEATDEHWGYKKQGGNYAIGGGLVQWGTATTATSGEYLEACQVILVGGRLRMGVDAQQVDLAISPLNDAGNAHRDPGFLTKYANYIKQVVNTGMSTLPAGYAAPAARFPRASASLRATHSDVTSPATINVTTAAVGAKRRLLAFGFYVDYLSEDTLQAYQCASTKNNTGACRGLGAMEPLETLPLQSLNVANLGLWKSSRADVVSVAETVYKQGLVEFDGGIATVQPGTAGTPENPTNIVLTMAMNNSSSGAAGTFAVDPDDADDSNIVSVLQNFVRTGSGTSTTTLKSLFVTTASSSTINIGQIAVAAGGRACSSISNKDATKKCDFDAPHTGLIVSLTGYTTASTTKPRGGIPVTTITDRKICLPPGVSGSVTNNGALADTTTITLALAVSNYRLTIDIVRENDSCPSGTTSFISVP